MNFLKKIFSENKDVVPNEAKKDSNVKIHCYTDYKHVIDVLTKEFGFEYDGIGDNGEECFYKNSNTPEKIYVHPMLCSYTMRDGKEWNSNEKYGFRIQSEFNSQSEQKEAI